MADTYPAAVCNRIPRSPSQGTRIPSTKCYDIFFNKAAGEIRINNMNTKFAFAKFAASALSL